MENVAEIYNAYSGEVRDEILETLREFGYDAAAKVLFAPDYGVPQRRRRCFFFASSTGVPPAMPEARFAADEALTLLGTVNRYRSAWSAISDLPVLKNGEGQEPTAYTSDPENEYQAEMRQDSEVLFDHVARKLSPKQFARVSALGRV